jgi:hypothetical protein
MSWISKNYEKAAIAGAVAVGLGCGYFGFQSYASIDDRFTHTLSGPRPSNSDPSVAQAEDVPGALNSRSMSHVWEQHQFEDRPVNLFTGVALFVRRDSAEPVDLLKSKNPVHPPITNDWWLTYELDPSFADSPKRDSDGDGFSELEEFNAKTKPTDPRDHPPLITKLTYVADESRTWRLEFSSDIGAGQYQFKYVDRDATGRAGANRTDFIAAGAKFFVDGTAAVNRFELVEVTDVQKENPTTGTVETVKIARVRDLKPNKNNEVFEVPRQMRNRGAYDRQDRSAVLVLKAVKEGANQFKVEENTSFSLPSGQTEKPYKLIKVTPESIEVEYPAADGSRATIVIPKGDAAPASNP